MILPSAASLDEFPGLVPWLVDGGWQAEFQGVVHVGPESGLICQSIEVTDGEEAAEYGCNLLIISKYAVNAEGLKRTTIPLKYTYDKATRRQRIRMSAVCDCAQVRELSPRFGGSGNSGKSCRWQSRSGVTTGKCCPSPDDGNEDA